MRKRIKIIKFYRKLHLTLDCYFVGLFNISTCATFIKVFDWARGSAGHWFTHGHCHFVTVCVCVFVCVPSVPFYVL